MRKMDSIETVVTDATKAEVNKLTRIIQRDAKLNAPSRTGGLRNSIHVETYEKGKSIIGRVFTNHHAARFVEFGTGPVGRDSPKILPDGISILYRNTPWVVPASKFPNYKDYNYPTYEKNGEVYIIVRGQPAKQFMTEAVLKNKKRIKQITKAISKFLISEVKK